MFSKTMLIHTYFENINGLISGNNVRLSGIDIGTVSKVEIRGVTKIYVEMSIEEKYAEFIGINSVASLGTDGLMGNRLVNIEPGINYERVIKNGDEIQSKEVLSTDEMMLTLDKTNKNISIVSEDLVNITRNINKSKGTLYSVLLDTSLAESVNNSLNNISEISGILKNFSSDLLQLSTDIRKGEGVLGELTNDNSRTHVQFDSTIANLRISSENLSRFSNTLRETMDSIKFAKGSVSTLLYDTVVAGQLRSSMANIDSGTVQLNELMNALKENFLFRKYFRRQNKNK
ncbi:MAG TPA: MlaD family protein [Bacteroidia bacterium]|nr:MlaD family protein [Bacteroidia bacterium]